MPEKTITEKLSDSDSGTRMTRRVIDGHSCYLRLATYNKEEARLSLSTRETTSQGMSGQKGISLLR